MPKIIITKGDALTPARFWERAVCEEHEFTDELKAEGWTETDSRTYLSDGQIAQLDQEGVHRT